MGIAQYFQPREFACKCGCGENRMAGEFLTKLETMRAAYYRRPMVISSGYRCPAHDSAVGGVGNHPLGLAADIIVPKGEPLMHFLHAAFAVNIRRAILYRDKPHVHLDDNPDAPGGIFVK